MSKLIKPDQGGALARQLARERVKRSKLDPKTLTPDDRDLDVFRDALRSEKRAKPSSSVSDRIIKRLA